MRSISASRTLTALGSLAVVAVLTLPHCGSQDLDGPIRALLQTDDSLDDELGPSTQVSDFQEVLFSILQL